MPQSLSVHALGMRVLLYRSHLANEKEPSQAYYNRNWLAYPVVAYVKSESRPYSDGVTRCPEGKDFIDYSIASNEKLLLDYGIDGFYYDIAANPCANFHNRDAIEPHLLRNQTVFSMLSRTSGSCPL